ncbi:MAG: ATPase [Gammaproteobacteria bacterium]|nr:ATPase [Gammaproteobacteria bacterium]|tara:strand:+ start:444 stop:992 length:549 start_codon:yes stop_codon:yes gene_type:complete
MTQVFILTGPESCGKTTLATALAGYWSAPLVEEQARSYLLEKGRDNPDFHYQEEDLLRIAERQLEAENHALEQQPARLICDTDLLVLMVWSEVKYGKCEPWIQKQFEHSLRHGQRHYILCDWQIPWQEDELREHPDLHRKELFQRYKQKMNDYGIIYTAVGGSTMQRFRQVYALVAREERAQ